MLQQSRDESPRTNRVGFGASKRVQQSSMSNAGNHFNRDIAPSEIMHPGAGGQRLAMQSAS